MKKIRKKKRGHGEKQASHERWLLTYADLITLLMVFFVVLYALSNISGKKFEAIAVSLSKSLGGGTSVLVSQGASVQGELNVTDSQVLKEIDELEKIKNQVDQYIKENELEDQLETLIEERGLVLSFKDVVLFPKGSAVLTPRSQEIIKNICGILQQADKYLRVEGHTDDLPINTTQYPSNWELSVARSTSVVREMIKADIRPERLSAAGYSEYRPKIGNTSEINRQLNRRVDIVILRSFFQNAEPLTEIMTIKDKIDSIDSRAN